MIAFKLAWSAVWVGAVVAFGVSYWRVDKARRSAAQRALEQRMGRFLAWPGWRDKRISEEFSEVA